MEQVVGMDCAGLVYREPSPRLYEPEKQQAHTERLVQKMLRDNKWTLRQYQKQ